MSWYMFWKECSRSPLRQKDYFWFEDKDYPNGDGIKEECELWAEKQPGGHNTQYQYGHELVEFLPSDVRRRKIVELTKKIQHYQAELGMFKSGCPHQIIRHYDSAVCSICDEDFGWWCPKSKDHRCVYTHDLDSCDFCGEPEERK